MRIVPVLFLAACAITDASFVCAEDAPFCATMQIVADERPAAKGVDIAAVYLYQGTEVPLMEDGQSIAPDLPVVAGRDAVFRIRVNKLDGFDDREVTARVLLFQEDQLIGAFQQDFTPAPFDETSLATTANVRVGGGALLAGDIGWKVEIVERAADVLGNGKKGTAEWPEKDPEPLHTSDNGEEMRIRLVPVHFEGDEAGVPDLSDAQLELIRDRIWSLYPVKDVALSIDEPWDTTADMTGFDGWTTLLSEITSLRATRGVPGDVWIYGLLAPSGYGGGVAGLSNVGSPPPDALDEGPRASIGIGFTGLTTPDTMAHEMGHASGRLHSPGCGAGGPDPEFPYEDGTLGRRGYDLVNNVLLESDVTYDHMTYCAPTWVSDYNYNWYFEKVEAVNAWYRGEGDGQAQARGLRPAWRAVWEHPSGKTTWGEARFGVQYGAPRTVELLDGAGRVLGTVEGVFQPFDHVPGGVVSFPEPGPDVAAVRVDGRIAAR